MARADLYQVPVSPSGAYIVSTVLHKTQVQPHLQANFMSSACYCKYSKMRTASHAQASRIAVVPAHMRSTVQFSGTVDRTAVCSTELASLFCVCYPDARLSKAADDAETHHPAKRARLSIPVYGRSASDPPLSFARRHTNAMDMPVEVPKLGGMSCAGREVPKALRSMQSGPARSVPALHTICLCQSDLATLAVCVCWRLCGSPCVSARVCLFVGVGVTPRLIFKVSCPACSNCLLG